MVSVLFALTIFAGAPVSLRNWPTYARPVIDGVCLGSTCSKEGFFIKTSIQWRLQTFVCKNSPMLPRSSYFAVFFLLYITLIVCLGLFLQFSGSPGPATYFIFCREIRGKSLNVLKLS